MKKTFLVFGALALTTISFAQKKKIGEARDFYDMRLYDKALASINEAVANEDTKKSADAWYLRGLIYENMSIQDTAQKHPELSDEAYTSFQKVLELKPDFSDPNFSTALYAASQLSYNQGITAYNRQDYKTAYNYFSRINTIYKTNNGKMFAEDKNFTTFAQNARQNAAYSAYNSKDYTTALPIFEELRNMPGAADSNVYTSEVNIYEEQNNTTAELATIREGEMKFPNSQALRNAERNYYVRTHDYASLTKQMEDAAKNDPGNPDHYYELSTTYSAMAYPNASANTPPPTPAQYDEWSGKAESNITNALKARPDDLNYNYHAGYLYYNKGIGYNDQMNSLVGTRTKLPPVELKTYEALKAKRDAAYTQSEPYFEKVYAQYDTRVASLKAEEMVDYSNAMRALNNIYSVLGKKEKADAMKKKLEANKK